MAEYPDFKHGTYGEVIADGLGISGNGKTKQAIVYIGTAPVNQVEGGAKNVNKPILLKNIADAKKYLGYSDDWAKYTLCEAMHVFLELNGIGPLVLINVLDPKTTHKSSTATTKSATPSNGKIVIAGAEDAILDTIKVETQATPPDRKSVV